MLIDHEVPNENRNISALILFQRLTNHNVVFKFFFTACFLGNHSSLFNALFIRQPFPMTTDIKPEKQKDVSMKTILKRILLGGLRKNKRYKAKEDVYVKLEKSFRKNQVDDISLSGLSFYYVENGHAIGKGSRYLKLQAGKCHTVEPIRFQVASDTNVGESRLPNNKIRRLSLHFEGLTFRQKRQLKNLIKHHSVETI